MTDLVRVWIVPVEAATDGAAGWWDLLDDGERARAGAFLSPLARRRFTVAHGALRVLAGRELNARPQALAWLPGRYGKPELPPPWSRLHTSLSHSAGMVAVAVSPDRPVGVDIQHLVPGLDTVALSARFFPPDEAADVAAGPDASARADCFARLWARKEAVVKAAGGRLPPNLKIAVRGSDVVGCAEPAGTHRVVDVHAPAGYRAAVALSGAERFVVDAVTWPGDGPQPAAGNGDATR